MTFEDVLSALVTLFDVVGEGLVALSLGFSSSAAGIGFLIGAIMVFSFKSVVPISFEVESLTVVAKQGNRDWRTMCYISLVACLITVILGGLEFFGTIVQFIQGPILSGMMTGVGAIMVLVSIKTCKDSIIIGATSIAVALLAYFLFAEHEHNLIYSLVASIAASILVSRFVHFTPIATKGAKDGVKLIPFKDFWLALRRPAVIRGILALLSLRIGGSIAYSEIDAQLARIASNVDHVNIIAGISAIASSLFGGAPIGPIISVTSAAPTPHYSGALMMAVAGILLLFGMLPKLARHTPMGSIAGFLFILGAVIAIPGNFEGMFTDTDFLSGPVTCLITLGLIDPFLGMVGGIAVRFAIEVI